MYLQFFIGVGSGSSPRLLLFFIVAAVIVLGLRAMFNACFIVPLRISPFM